MEVLRLPSFLNVSHCLRVDEGEEEDISSLLLVGIQLRIPVIIRVVTKQRGYISVTMHDGVMRDITLTWALRHQNFFLLHPQNLSWNLVIQSHTSTPEKKLVVLA